MSAVALALALALVLALVLALALVLMESSRNLCMLAKRFVGVMFGISGCSGQLTRSRKCCELPQWAMQVPEALQATDDGAAEQQCRESLLGVLLGFAFRQNLGVGEIPDLAAKLGTPSELSSAGIKSVGKYVTRVQALLKYILTADVVFAAVVPDTSSLGLGAKPSTESFVGGLLALRDTFIYMGIGGSSQSKTIHSLNGRVGITAAFLALRAHYLGDSSAQVRARAKAHLEGLMQVSSTSCPEWPGFKLFNHVLLIFRLQELQGDEEQPGGVE
jgi:hypothetical protein